VKTDCVGFLQWALPQLQLRWPGFRRVHRQVCRKIDRRRVALALADLVAYRRHLEATPDEWVVLDSLCRVTISRFARDRAVWNDLVAHVLPRLADEARAAGRATVRAWSAGCGAGEEPYSLAIAWQLAIASPVPLDVLATDLDEHQLGRAAVASYPIGTLRELPDAWRRAAFDAEQLRPQFRAGVRFARHDVRTPPPEHAFDLVACRNLAFTYLADPVQRQVASHLHAALRPGGALVVGIHEQLPDACPGFTPARRAIYIAT